MVAGAVAVGAVALIALFAALWFQARADNESLEDQLKAAEEQNADLTAEIDGLEEDLARVEKELDQARAMLTTTESALATSQQDVASANEQLSVTQGQLTATQSQLTSVQGQVDAAQLELTNLRADAERCSSGGQTFVDALNKLVEVNRRFENGQATLVELEVAANEGQAAYDAFLVNCGIEPAP